MLVRLRFKFADIAELALKLTFTAVMFWPSYMGASALGVSDRTPLSLRGTAVTVVVGMENLKGFPEFIAGAAQGA